MEGLKKILVILSQIVLGIFLPLAILFSIVGIYAFNHDFYMKEFDKYNIEKVTQMSREDLSRVTEKLIEYLKGNEEDLNIKAKINGQTEEVFGNREKMHMEDVKDLFRKGVNIRKNATYLTIVAILTILGQANNRRKALFKGLMISGIAPLILMIILFILTQIDFHKYFTHFHEIFFTNDLWLLNPKTDVLIQMLPLEFFIDITRGILTWFMGIMITIMGVSYTGIKLTTK